MQNAIDSTTAKVEPKFNNRTKLYMILAIVGAIIVFALIIFGLYQLGDADESALERLRDISIIFMVLLMMITVVLLAGITAALVYLILQVKDRIIPMLEETTTTVRRMRGTAEFVSDEAIKPIVTIASKYASAKAMAKTFVERPSKKK
jgi:hypothetical protein